MPEIIGESVLIIPNRSTKIIHNKLPQSTLLAKMKMVSVRGCVKGLFIV